MKGKPVKCDQPLRLGNMLSSILDRWVQSTDCYNYYLQPSYHDISHDSLGDYLALSWSDSKKSISLPWREITKESPSSSAISKCNLQ